MAHLAQHPETVNTIVTEGERADSIAREKWHQRQLTTNQPADHTQRLQSPFQPLTIEVEKMDRPLGIALKDSEDEPGVWIDEIEDGSAADMNPDLVVGVRVLAVNGQTIEDAHSESQSPKFLACYSRLASSCVETISFLSHTHSVCVFVCFCFCVCLRPLVSQG